MLRPTQLSDAEKVELTHKRTSHIKPAGTVHEYTAHQPVWFTDDASKQWSPGVSVHRDQGPNSYWVVGANNRAPIRRNITHLKHRMDPIAPGLNAPPIPLAAAVPQMQLPTLANGCGHASNSLGAEIRMDAPQHDPSPSDAPVPEDHNAHSLPTCSYSPVPVRLPDPSTSAVPPLAGPMMLDTAAAATDMDKAPVMDTYPSSTAENDPPVKRSKYGRALRCPKRYEDDV